MYILPPILRDAKGNPQAKRGYSRLVGRLCSGLHRSVTTREGLPIAFEVFDGNRPDVTDPPRRWWQSMEANTAKEPGLVMDRAW